MRQDLDNTHRLQEANSVAIRSITKDMQVLQEKPMHVLENPSGVNVNGITPKVNSSAAIRQSHSTSISG
jgi:hypothetical protein